MSLVLLADMLFQQCLQHCQLLEKVLIYILILLLFLLLMLVILFFEIFIFATSQLQIQFPRILFGSEIGPTLPMSCDDLVVGSIILLFELVKYLFLIRDICDIRAVGKHVTLLLADITEFLLDVLFCQTDLLLLAVACELGQ